MSSIRDFVPLTKLGEGTYSSVYKVRRNSDENIYALKKVKLFQLSTKEKQNALTQIRILASIQSPNIIAYKEAFFDDKLNVLCIVMEYADGGDLLQIVQKHKKDNLLIKQSLIWVAVAHILTGLNTLHSKGVLHRDLKCANVFKSGSIFKLGDLNVSKVDKGKLARTQTGTPYYASPQVWRDDPYDSKSDIWSLGCIIYQMAALKPPFGGKDLEELYQSVQTKPVPKIPASYSRQLRDLLTLCLQKQPHLRPTAYQLLQNSLFKSILNGYGTNCSQNLSSVQQNTNLLKTIQLPTDLKDLKQNLPSSKYVADKIFLPIQRASISSKAINMPYDNALQKPIKTQISLKNDKQIKAPRNQIYLSPTNRSLALRMKSPETEKKDQKINMQKYSERLYVSDKKNKISQNKSNMYVQKSQVMIKKRNPGVAKYDYCLNQIQELKKNLQKRRVCSNGANKNYWG